MTGAGAGAELTGATGAGGIGGDDWRVHARRLWVLILFLVVATAAARTATGIANAPQFAIHSDDVILMKRFRDLPRPATFESSPYHYVHGIDHPALERYVFHFLLKWTGRLPGELPTWDYSRDFTWNVSMGNVAPPDAVRLARGVNALFMVAAACLIFLAVARAVSPVAGLAAGLYFGAHPAMVEILWSIGPDPLQWLMLALGLYLWVVSKVDAKWAVIVGGVGGLAAATKINGGFFVLAYCLWLLLKRRPLLALASGAVSLAVFIALNPVVFGGGVMRVPVVLWEFVAWRGQQARELIANLAARQPTPMHIAYRDASHWRIPFMLLGQWVALVPLMLVSPRMRRLDPVPFWGIVLLVGNAFTITAPERRYLLPVQAGLVIGLIAAYWPATFGIDWKPLEARARRVWAFVARRAG